MKIPSIDSFENNVHCTEKYILKHYKEFYFYLIKTYPEDLKFGEKLFWYYNDITSHPLCKCGERLKFLSFWRGYQKFCSKKCSSNDAEVREKFQKTCKLLYGGVGTASEQSNSKRKETLLAKYGVDHPLKSRDIQEKKNNTCISKYGVAHMLQSELYKGQIHDNIKKKNLSRIGVEYPFQSHSIRNKCSSSITEKYGVDNAMKNEEVKERLKNTIKNKILDHNPDIIDIHYQKFPDESFYLCRCPNPECQKCEDKNFTIPPSLYWRRKYYKIELCTHLNPIPTNKCKNTWIEKFVKDLLDSRNIAYINNTRSVISPLEIDIYIPDLKLGIECNGCYWHSLKDPLYHYTKYLKCYEMGVDLINIWEDDVIHYPQYIKSIILSRLSVQSDVGDLEIQNISNKDARNFLRIWGRPGSHKCKTYKGIFSNDKLVGIFGFNLIHERIKINNISFDGEEVSFGRIIGAIYDHFDNRVDLLLDNDFGHNIYLEKLGFLKKHNKNYQILPFYVYPNTFIRSNNDPGFNCYKIYNSGKSEFIIK